MKSLLELRRALPKPKIKNISLLTKPSKEHAQTLLQRFYEALKDENIQEDKDMAEYLYAKSFKSVKATFLKLKSMLRERMFNIILFTNFMQDKFRERDHAQTNCYRDLTAYQILKNAQAREITAWLAKKITKKATYYELTQLCITVPKELMAYYAIHQPNKYFFKKYNGILKEQLKIYQQEYKINMIRREAITLYETRRSAFKEISQKIQTQIQILEKTTKQANTPKAITSRTFVMLLAYHHGHHIRKRIALCEETLHKFDKKPFPNHRERLIFSINLVLGYIEIEDFEKAQKTLQQTIKLNKQHGFNWFKTMEIYHLLYLRSGQYDKALEVIREVFAAEAFQKQKQHTREVWDINRAFVEFLLRAGIIADNGRPRPSFRLARFLNSVPIFSKDKQGLNLNILIMQFMHLLIDERKHDQLIDKTESLRQYAYRHLNNHLHRPQLFIKMLCTIPEADFKPEFVQSKAQKWLDQLSQHPLELADQPFEIELIPFEKLWEMAMEILKEQERNRYKK